MALLRALAHLLSIPVFIALTLCHLAGGQTYTYTVLHHFDGTDGATPNGLARDRLGILYGTTQQAEASGGVVFKLSETRTFEVIHNFSGPEDGSYPWAAPTLDPSGNIYGTTVTGGAFNAGTVYKIDPSGVESILYNFDASNLGYSPRAALIRDPAGNLYGTAPAESGVAFRIDTNGAYHVIYTFFPHTGGAIPYGGLARDSAGTLFGEAVGGGANNYGTIFKITPDHSETVLYSFTAGNDGEGPNNTPILDSAGNIYGTAYEDGSGDFGTVFKLDPSGAFTVLHAFTSGSDGAYPFGGLVMDASGNLYGTTIQGGASNLGVVFKVDPSGVETILHTFSGPDGGTPNAGLLISSEGVIFGTATKGGKHNRGVVFRLKP